MGYECHGALDWSFDEVERYGQRQARAVVAKKLKRAFACPLYLKLELIPTRSGKPESRTARWTRIGVEDQVPTLHRNALTTRAAIDAVGDGGPEHNATAEQRDEEKGRDVEVVQLC